MITAKILRQLLHYEPETGNFTWLEERNKGCLGKRAGFLDCGYWRIYINGKGHRAHRLAWLYMTGEPPKNQIDHRNLNKLDNRWANLREATHAQNIRNNAGYKTRKSSRFKGVYRGKGRRKWEAMIFVDGKIKRLGNFESEEDAHAAYVAAATLHYGEFANGG